MAYISRGDAIPFIIEQRSPEIIAAATEQSVAMQTFDVIPVGTKTYRYSLVDSFPDAQWLVPGAPPNDDPDTVVKPTTTMTWSTQDILVEEAATICAIPENVLDDSGIDLWAQVKKYCAAAVARLVDQTFFFGTAPTGSVPASFPVGGIFGQAVAANHDQAWEAAVDLVDVWNEAMALVEADGFDVSDGYSDRKLKTSLRGLRDQTGNPLYIPGYRSGGDVDSFYGIPLHFLTNGAWDPTKAAAILGDASMAKIIMRQQLTAKLLDQATLTNIGNLAEKDMLAIRLKTRMGFGILVPKGLGQTATPFPFSVILPKAVTP